MVEMDKKPFCVKGGECIGNVPTIEQIRDALGFIVQEGIYEQWETGSFVIDGAIHSFDMSGKVGEQKCLVFGMLQVGHPDTEGMKFEVRNNDTLVVEAVVYTGTSGASVWNCDVMFQTDENGCISYKIDSGVNLVTLRLKCWISVVVKL